MPSHCLTDAWGCQDYMCVCDCECFDCCAAERHPREAWETCRCEARGPDHDWEEDA